MCDLSDATSLENVMEWIGEIYQKANYDDPAIMVLGNKCDKLEHINMTTVCKMETDLEERHPEI